MAMAVDTGRECRYSGNSNNGNGIYLLPRQLQLDNGCTPIVVVVIVDSSRVTRREYTAREAVVLVVVVVVVVVNCVPGCRGCSPSRIEARARARSGETLLACPALVALGRYSGCTP